MKPATFDGDEKRLLLIMLAREGQEAISRRGTSRESLEFSARCFDLAAKVARTAGPEQDGVAVASDEPEDQPHG